MKRIFIIVITLVLALLAFADNTIYFNGCVGGQSYVITAKDVNTLIPFDPCTGAPAAVLSNANVAMTAYATMLPSDFYRTMPENAPEGKYCFELWNGTPSTVDFNYPALMSYEKRWDGTNFYDGEVDANIAATYAKSGDANTTLVLGRVVTIANEANYPDYLTVTGTLQPNSTGRYYKAGIYTDTYHSGPYYYNTNGWFLFLDVGGWCVTDTLGIESSTSWAKNGWTLEGSYQPQYEATGTAVVTAGLGSLLDDANEAHRYAESGDTNTTSIYDIVKSGGTGDPNAQWTLIKVLCADWLNGGRLDLLIDSIVSSAGTASACAIVNSGQGFRGTVTSVPDDPCRFAISTLAGVGAGSFVSSDVNYSWNAYVFRDDGGLGGAPQGEQKTVTAYDDANGTFTTNAFSVPVAVSDNIIILGPPLANIRAIKTDTVSILADTNDLPGRVQRQMDVNSQIKADVNAIEKDTDEMQQTHCYQF